MKKRILFLMLFMVLLLSACGRTEIDLTKYIRYEINGVNGKGKMFLSLDEQLYADAVEKTDKISAEAVRKIIERDVALSSGKDRLLSNGDEAVIEASCLSEDEDLKKAGIRLLPGSKTVKIAGLREAREIDLTKDILVDVQGFDGGGELSVRFAEKLYNTIADLSQDMTTEKVRELLQASVPLAADKSSELSDGDTVTITADVSDVNAAFLEQGLVLTGGKVTHTVSGLQPLKHFSASDYVSYDLSGTVPYLTAAFDFSENVPEELTPFITLPWTRPVTLRKSESREFEIKYKEAELRKRGYVCDEAAFSVSPDGFELEKYMEKLSEITEANKQLLAEKTQDAAYAAALNETKHLTFSEGDVFGDTLEDVSLFSSMLFTRKFYSDVIPYNYLVLVYKADYTAVNDHTGHDEMLYVTLTFENAALDPSGNIIYSEPTVEIKLPDSLETDIAMRKADYELEEMREE